MDLLGESINLPGPVIEAMITCISQENLIVIPANNGPPSPCFLSHIIPNGSQLSLLIS